MKVQTLHPVITLTLQLVSIHADRLHMIETFLKAESTDHLVLCESEFFDDENYHKVIEFSHNFDLYLEKWDCFNNVPKLNKALIVTNNPNPIHFSNLLNQKDAQRSLASNIWLIISRNDSMNLLEYFDNNELRIGLNAQIFFAKGSGTNVSLHQAYGIGKTKPQIKVHPILFIKSFNS